MRAIRKMVSTFGRVIILEDIVTFLISIADFRRDRKYSIDLPRTQLSIQVPRLLADNRNESAALPSPTRGSRKFAYLLDAQDPAIYDGAACPIGSFPI